MYQLALRSATKAAARRHFLASIDSQTHHCRQQIRPLAIGWVEFVGEKYDPKTQTWKAEDPEQTVSRIQEEKDSKGQTILNSPKNLRNARHVKPTTYRKELANKIAYQRKRQEVMDLIKYIHFVKDHKDKDNW